MLYCADCRKNFCDFPPFVPSLNFFCNKLASEEQQLVFLPSVPVGKTHWKLLVAIFFSVRHKNNSRGKRRKINAEQLYCHKILWEEGCLPFLLLWCQIFGEFKVIPFKCINVGWAICIKNKTDPKYILACISFQNKFDASGTKRDSVFFSEIKFSHTSQATFLQTWGWRYVWS